MAPTHRQLALGLAVLLLAYALLTTPFWRQTARLFSSDGLSYSERRIAYAFARVPVDRIAEKLNAVLPPTTPISLPPGSDASFLQRMTEALYPRPIVAGAPYTLDLGAPALVTGPLPSPAPPVSPPSESFDFDALRFLASLLAALGYGMAALLVLDRRGAVASAHWPGLALLLGVLVITAATSIATMLQRPLPARGFAALGITLLTATLAWCWRQQELPTRLRAQLAALRRQPEWLLLLALLALLFVRMACFPVTLWDGRSIWLFSAKRIFTHSMYALADLTGTDAEWTHTAYPLLLPAWLAHFSALGAQYNERLASLGIPLLYGALLALVWPLSRASIGRWPGAAFTLALFFWSERLVSGGYADAYVMLLLFITVLALSGGHERVGWVAALALSLVKSEGMLFAAAALAAGLLLSPQLRRRSLARRVAPFAVLLPAVIYAAWTRAAGVPDPNSQIEWSMGWGVLLDRTRLVLAQTPAVLLDAYGDYLRIHPFLRASVVALPCALASWLLLRGRVSRDALRTPLALLVYAAALAVIAVLGIATAPFDTQWMIEKTLDRLLLHPAIFLVFLPFLFLRAGGREADAG